MSQNKPKIHKLQFNIQFPITEKKLICIYDETQYAAIWYGYGTNTPSVAIKYFQISHFIHFICG